MGEGESGLLERCSTWRRRTAPAPRVLLPLGALDTARLCLGESEAPPLRRDAYQHIKTTQDHGGVCGTNQQD